MANTLLSDSTLLSIRFDGNIILPEKSRSKAPAVKTVIDVLRYGNPELLFVGDENHKPSNSDCQFFAGKSVARIHVIDAPSRIDFDSPNPMLFKWFLKQLRSNKQHIVLIDSIENNDQQLTVVDIYVRGVFIPIRETNVRSLHYHSNNMNYAV